MRTFIEGARAPVITGCTYYHWPLDGNYPDGEGSGQHHLKEIVHDLTGYVVNSSGWLASTNTPNGHGRTLNFPGVNLGESYWYHSGSEMDVGTSDFSVACWLWMDTNSRPIYPDSHVIVCRGRTGIGGYNPWYACYYILIGDRSEIGIRLWDSSNNLENYEIEYEFDTDCWHHIAVTVDRGTEAKLYINTNLVGTDATTQTVRDATVTHDPKTYWASAADFNDTGAYYPKLDGRMTDCWWANKVLSQEEIRQIYKYVAA